MKIAAMIAFFLLALGCKGEDPEPRPQPMPVVPTTPPPWQVPLAGAPDAGRPVIDHPAGIEPVHLEAAAAIEAWFKTVTAAARGNANDCIAMAAALSTIGAKGRPLVARATRMQKELRKADPAAATWLEEHTRARMSDGFNDLVAAMGPCGEHATVRESLKAIAR